jgi:hypothetical protein
MDRVAEEVNEHQHQEHRQHDRHDQGVELAAGDPQAADRKR